MSNGMRMVIFWIGLIALAVILSSYSIWVALIAGFVYGVFTGTWGYYAFPFQYRNKDHLDSQ